MAEDTVRCWLVEREIWDEDVVTLVYATTDGTHHHTRQLAANLVVRTEITAAIDVPEDELEPAAADDTDRYATEAQRMAEQHDPDDVI